MNGMEWSQGSGAVNALELESKFNNIVHQIPATDLENTVLASTIGEVSSEPTVSKNNPENGVTVKLERVPLNMQAQAKVD